MGDLLPITIVVLLLLASLGVYLSMNRKSETPEQLRLFVALNSGPKKSRKRHPSKSGIKAKTTEGEDQKAQEVQKDEEWDDGVLAELV